MLLDKGADAGARDKEGWTAFALALFSSDDRKSDVLKLLPQPRRIQVMLEPALAAENLYSSCTMSPQQLALFVAGLGIETLVGAGIRQAAATPGAGPVDFVLAHGDATVDLGVRPQVSCVTQQSMDNLSLAIDVRVRVKDRPGAIFEKTFGGGLTGLHARRASSPAQYGGFFGEWARKHAEPIYWEIVEALLKAGL
jgi:hypothetical protein